MTHPHIGQFLNLVHPWSPAYRTSTFSFIALLHENAFVILAARLNLSSRDGRKPKQTVRTQSLVAAEVAMAGDMSAVVAFSNAALAGSPLLVGEYVLSLLNDGSAKGYCAHHDHASAPGRGWRRFSHLDYLRLSGARRWDLINQRMAELERELQPLGYRGLDNLMTEFGFALSDSDAVFIEIAAEPVLCISPRSRLFGQTVEIEVHVPDCLPAEQLVLTLVDGESGGGSFRRSIDSTELHWSMTGRDRIGRYTLHLSTPSVLTCRALYAGSLHDEVELYDPAVLPNLRRTIVELCDPGLQRLIGPITAPKSKQEQNDFEASVAVLLYMLGFDTVRVGGVKKLSDAADIFATTPSGRILVVECTTAVLDPKNKIGKLLDRIDQAKARLLVANIKLNPEHVIGVVFMPKMRVELGTEWRVAQERGVLVLCRPEIEQAIARTRFPSNADVVLDAWLGLGLIELMSNGLKFVDGA